MADNLEISCPECDKMMNLPAEMAGKKVRCKACGHVFRVEAAAPGGKAKAKSVKAKEAPKAAKAKPAAKGKADAKGKAKRGTHDQADANPYGLTEEYLGPRCPFCAQAMEEGDVICLECGYNTQTRQRQETRRVAERNFNDWFLWLFPAIMGIFIVLTLVVFDIWFIWYFVPKADEESWFSLDSFRKGVKLWWTIGTLFIMFFCVVFAFKRLVLNPIPPERSKPMEFATVVKIMAALALGSLLMLAAVAIPAIFIVGLGLIPIGIGFWAMIITLFSAGWGTVTTALQYNNVGTVKK